MTGPAAPPLPPDVAWLATKPEAASGGAGTPLVQRAVATLYPPDQVAPLGSQDIYQLAPPTAVGPGPAAQVVGLAAFRVPPRMMARIQTFGVNVLNMAASSQLTWRLRVNQQPAGPWGATQIAANPVAVAARDFAVYVLVRENAVIDLAFQVDDVAAYTLQAFYSGWLYPLATHQAYYGASQLVTG